LYFDGLSMYFLIYSSLYIPPAQSERHIQPTFYYVFFAPLTNLSSVSYTIHRQMVERLLESVVEGNIYGLI